MATNHSAEENMGATIEASAVVSASRQKNCNGCVQAKRRCDRRTPVCSRCVEKKIACVYTKSRTATRPGKRARQPTPPHTEPLSFGSPAYSPIDIPGLSFDLNYFENIPTSFNTSVGAESTQQSIQDTPTSSDISIDAFMHFMGNNDLSSSDQWLVNHLPERPSTPADEEVVRGWDKMAACKIESWHTYDSKTTLYYILNRVKEFPKEMATKSSTPFIHEHLYHDYTPQCIISCFSTCVLYANRTPTNAAMAMRALSSSARELVDAESSRVVVTPIDKLARCQALFLYQVIRLFDGDIALRAQGEKDMELSKIWLEELRHTRDNLGNLARLEYSSVKEESPIEWEKWIFAECVRRTIIMSYAVTGLYEVMKDPDNIDANDPWAYVHRWTLGRSLWEASSPTQFQRAWKETPHFVITNFMFEDFIENGKRDDVDGFTEILLTVYMGNDAMKEFMTPAMGENATS
ncbi:hypothetical protein GGR51DRAFT_527770 [Nemania sp. FL0031]|nr:hypothetical protein GGR51DRAFT_527770 [Nemania sp. FL0031]